MQNKKKVLIIGAGLGGLSTALRLSSAGYAVEIVEKYHQAGGRLNQMQKDGFTFDVGPSFFSMSYEFDELFSSCNIPNPLKLKALDPVYSVYFEGNEKPFHIYKSLKMLAEQFAATEPDFEKRAEKYLRNAATIFHDTEHKVIKKNFNSILHYLVSLSKVPLKHTPYLFRSMWTELEKHFESEEVKVIFSLVAFFLGATPFDTPAVYSLLNYTELKHDGYWHVEGGMYKITEEILKLLDERSVKIHYNTEIKSVDANAFGINYFLDQNNKKWQADIYVSNSDAAAFRGNIIGHKKFTEPKLDKMQWTLSPFTIYLGVKGKIDKLQHHNYFLGKNFKDYANTIFKTSISPQKPYYYVNASSKSDFTCAPEGCENLFILCPVPDLRYKPNWEDAEILADTIINDLGNRVGYDIKSNTLTKTIWTPKDWQQNFNLYKGSGLGLAHGMKQIGAFRPRNKDEKFKNLYYVGASTTPGTGLPIVVIGSKLVTDRILHEHATVQ